MKAARGPYKQGKALCDSLIKQRKCKLSLARRSSWQNWSFTRGSSQDVRLCSPHNTEKEGLFLTSSCFLFYNSTLSQLDALPVSRPGCLSVCQSVGRSVATVSEFGPRWLEERPSSTQQRYCFHCSLWTTPIIADWKYVAANRAREHHTQLQQQVSPPEMYRLVSQWDFHSGFYYYYCEKLHQLSLVLLDNCSWFCWLTVLAKNYHC